MRSYTTYVVSLQDSECRNNILFTTVDLILASGFVNMFNEGQYRLHNMYKSIGHEKGTIRIEEQLYIKGYRGELQSFVDNISTYVEVDYDDVNFWCTTPRQNLCKISKSIQLSI